MIARNLFGASTVGIALFFVWPAVVSPWSQVAALKAVLAERTQILQDRSGILEKFKDEYAKYKSIEQSPDGRLFLSLVPPKKDSAELLSAMETIAAQSGLQLSAVTFAEVKSKLDSQYETETLTVEMSGTYPSFRAFLGDVEAYVRILNVQSLEIFPTKVPGMLTYKIRAETYFSK